MRENGHPSAPFLVCLASPEDLVSIAVQDIPGWDTQDFQMVSTSVREAVVASYMSEYSPVKP